MISHLFCVVISASLTGGYLLLGSMVTSLPTARPCLCGVGEGVPGCQILAGSTPYEFLALICLFFVTFITTSNIGELLPCYWLVMSVIGVQVQAEEVSEVTDRFEVSVVPYFVLLKVAGRPMTAEHLSRNAKVCEPATQAKPCIIDPQDGEVVDKVEGADAATLTQAVQQHFSQASKSKPQAATSGHLSSTPARGSATAPASPEERITKLMTAQSVMLFMKVGPQCYLQLLPLSLTVPNSTVHAHKLLDKFEQCGRVHQMYLAAASAGRWWMH